MAVGSPVKMKISADNCVLVMLYGETESGLSAIIATIAMMLAKIA